MKVPVVAIRHFAAIAHARKHLKIAVEGCGHGELDNIYATLLDAERQEGFKVDLLVCCGDFQAVRNMADLASMACPDKYKQMNTFYKYYSGEKVAPVLTLFIGGNHEAISHHWELPYGGWVAPNIFYMGFASVVQFGGVRIAGLSGIYKDHDYKLGHFERPPFSSRDERSFYHVREYDVFQLSQIQRPIDVFLSHDWPRGITRFGNEARLLQQKKFFAAEVRDNRLGSTPAEALLHHLRPKYWFSAHLHVKFPAVVPHDPSTAPSPDHPQKTRFLALDKCLPRRDFLQILDVPSSGPLELRYDEEWLAILKSTTHLRPLGRDNVHMPVAGGPVRSDFRVRPEELEAMRDRLGSSPQVPLNFVRTAPEHVPGNRQEARAPQIVRENPQTVEFCARFELPNPCEAPRGHSGPPLSFRASGGFSSGGDGGGAVSNPDEINLDDEEEEEGGEGTPGCGGHGGHHDRVANPDEIDLGDEVPEEEDEEPPFDTHNSHEISLDDAPEPEEETGEVIVFKRRNKDVYSDKGQ